MTTNNTQETTRIEVTGDQKQTVTDVSTNDAEATTDAQELAGEELEERIAPMGIGDIPITKHTSTSSP